MTFCLDVETLWSWGRGADLSRVEERERGGLASAHWGGGSGQAHAEAGAGPARDSGPRAQSGTPRPLPGTGGAPPPLVPRPAPPRGLASVPPRGRAAAPPGWDGTAVGPPCREGTRRGGGPGLGAWARAGREGERDRLRGCELPRPRGRAPRRARPASCAHCDREGPFPARQRLSPPWGPLPFPGAVALVGRCLCQRWSGGRRGRWSEVTLFSLVSPEACAAVGT